MHSCPECGQACYCSGDIEDYDTSEEYLDDCTHHCRDVLDDLDELDDWDDEVEAAACEPDPRQRRLPL